MQNLVSLQPVDYLIIGHVSRDLTSDGEQLGGTAAYSALTARALGLRVGVVTACDEKINLDVFGEIPIVSVPSKRNTTFENIYSTGKRIQILHQRADEISLEVVPAPWRHAGIIHLGPIIREVDLSLPESFRPTLLGITPQGWLRAWDENGRVQRAVWENAEQALGATGCVVVSVEDVGNDEELIEFFARHTRILAVTDGAAGSRLYWHGDQRRFRAPEMDEVDATGAGDIYATAFFIRLQVTRDPWEAARFATHLAARSVTRTGLKGVPTATEIQECMVEVF
ncbi:MAG: PfkB family carbohydrate kinase [Anaerolineales bacterium]